MQNKVVTIGMVGVGRAAELHVSGYHKVYGITVRLKSVIAEHYENALKGKERYCFEKACKTYQELLDDPEIDVIDICSTPYTHEDMILQAFAKGKHVICEKPLVGYYGSKLIDDHVGNKCSKAFMYDQVCKSLERLKNAYETSSAKFMYAENFIYAPAITKVAEIITKKKSKVLCIKGEESLKGSSSSVAGLWSQTGGGTFTRTGSHPLSAALFLKQVESNARQENIRIKSIVADMGSITPSLTEYEHRHIAANPIDVEDFGTAIITFSDNTKAVIMATDTLLGGSKNYVDVYCNDAVMNCNLTMNDMLSTYFLDEDGLEDVYISEMLPSKLGWNNPFLIDEIVRGYCAQMQDFMEAIAYDREPISNFQLAYDTALCTYASYYSAETGKRVSF